jgi:hypothetical protein
MEGLDFRCDLFHGAGFPMARSAPEPGVFWVGSRHLRCDGTGQWSHEGRLDA